MAVRPIHHHELAFIFGVLGNIVSFAVYLAPLPTFWRVYKKKSTEGFQSIPYTVALFSAMLLLYYAFVKNDNATMIITINSVGCLIEGFYLTMYMIYAPKNARRKVISTKSVEFMPFWLSFCLTLCAAMWFFYGFLIRDFYIALPNILGFTFGITQMILYIIYKDSKKTKNQDDNGAKEADIKLEGLVTDTKLGTIEKIGQNNATNFEEQNNPQVIEVIVEEIMVHEARNPSQNRFVTY
ncbi:hypothetical protein Cgig2_008094 [Carnegiea gigantea]|uniref:Bidirectional sugar transporter SWEET n=1 Tax=Carnegiea gigantea TaxID=171969 RepID=A0A9Q1QUY4_9CARY|nr:hypothetical protein Cgig2_008094 [Carnegiea gigantea]